MIVIERTWKEPNSSGGGKINKTARKCFADDLDGGKINKTARKCFADDDLDGVNSFINETGYDWTNVEYNYIKL